MNKDQQKLCEDNMKLAYYIVSQYYPTYIHDEDITASALLGLCKAAESYNPEKGLFSTYAGQCVRNEINQEFITRKSYAKAVSLDNKVGEDLTLGEVLTGEDGVVYMDELFYEQLTDDEITVLQLDNMGYDTDEIAEMSGFGVQKVRKLLRMTKLKWKRFCDE